METTYADSLSDMAQLCDMELWVMKWRSAWPIFHSSVRPDVWSQIKCRSLWHTCQTWLNFVTWSCGSWSEGQHDLYFTVQYDPTFDLKLNVGHCDIYFMVQWLCLIPWKPFHVWTSLFGIMNQYDPTHDLKINVGHCVLYFMDQWFCLISGVYLIYVHHTFGVWISMTQHLTSK